MTTSIQNPPTSINKYYSFYCFLFVLTVGSQMLSEYIQQNQWKPYENYTKFMKPMKFTLQYNQKQSKPMATKVTINTINRNPSKSMNISLQITTIYEHPTKPMRTFINTTWISSNINQQENIITKHYNPCQSIYTSSTSNTINPHTCFSRWILNVIKI